MPKIYKMEFTEWEKDALIKIIENGNYTGKDIENVYLLINKIKQAKISDNKKEK